METNSRHSPNRTNGSHPRCEWCDGYERSFSKPLVDGKTGEHFLLAAKPSSTFGKLAARAKGAYKGPRDLSTQEGFGA
jgi:hypothetical protein